VEPPAQAVDPVDDPLHIEVDPGQVVLGEEPVDVVFVAQRSVLLMGGS
jgi:hypothetical protein